MSESLLLTKLYIPPARPNMVPRLCLVERLNEGLSSGRKLTLISAPAGFGKTTLVSEWLAGCGRPVAWLSLDEGDNDPVRFISYLIAALQTIKVGISEGLLAALQSPQPPPTESILTVLLNEITTIQDDFILVLDDNHLIDSKPVDEALTFLLEHLPIQMHLVIATREDPYLSLARLRARGQLTELRAADLRFTTDEAADFLNRVMGLNLPEADVAALEARTEGWIAGLQLAALSMQGQTDTTSFIQSFTGSHRFVLDYLVEEVLNQQPPDIQAFLVNTSLLNRLCGPLCDAVLGNPFQPSSITLELLERANLFLIPLDNERRWYRYHHLFAELLRKRLGQSRTAGEVAGLHIRASEWYEHNSLVFEAFHHATAANDVERTERLIESQAIGLHFRSVATAVMDWLASLPKATLDARPRLWVSSATLALMAGQTSGVEEKLQAAEKALQNSGPVPSEVERPDEKIRDLYGKIACARATLALTRYDPADMIVQAHRALEYLHPDNLAFRFSANWVLTSALMYQGERAAAAQACLEGLAISEKSGDIFSKILATSKLGELQELDNQLYQAAGNYRLVLQLSGDHPQPNAGETHLRLAHICYEWNDLDAAEQHGLQSLELTRQYDRLIDRFIIGEVFLARLKLARGDVSGAATILAQANQTAHQKNFTLRLPEIAAAQVPVLLKQDRLPMAAELARQYELPLSQARVLLAQDNPSAALAILEPFRQQMEARGWADERLRTMVLQTIALHLKGEKAKAAQALDEALRLAEPGGFMRLFVDEGEPMAELLTTAAAQGTCPDYTNKLLAAFEAEAKDQSQKNKPSSSIPDLSSLIEALSPRELEVLRLIAQGLSNQEIGKRMFLALDTIKGHNRRIFDKLQVQRRTEAIARARELGLL
ncbi:MAG: LuxR family transcriptional regulator [Chloroflexi bacterium HGW-Chloroflexi-10]|nr:MAG: LuxR family transcriptional regulator [Chloroflexi bacterium HGW-Chloroflexi-10]